MSKSGNGVLKFLLYFILPVTFISVLFISFFVFKKLIFPSDLTLRNGKKESQLAREIRSDLLTRKDLTLVSFRSKDGINLSGIFVKRKNPLGNVVLAHGFQSCKEFVSSIIDMLPEYNILLFDFRAHGKSGGRFRTLGCHEYKDLFAAVDFLKDRTKPNKVFSRKLPLYIIGISMGGAVAIDSLAKRSDLCDGLVVDSSFSNLEDVVYNSFRIKVGLPAYPFAPITIRMLNFVTSSDMSKICPIESVKKIDKPILFIHSCIDDVVKPQDTLNMYANSKNTKSKLWVGPVCIHGHLYRKYPDDYKKKLRSFLKGL